MDGSEILGEGERVEIIWPLVCRWLGFVWKFVSRPEGDCGAFRHVGEES